MNKKLFLFATLFACCLITLISCNSSKTKSNASGTDSSTAAQTNRPELVKLLTAEDFKTLVADFQSNKDQYIGKKPCVIDFYADWCGPCKQMAPIIESLAEEHSGKVVFYKVNIDNAAELADAYGIESIPTFFFCSTDGKITTEMGSQPKENFEEHIKSLK